MRRPDSAYFTGTKPRTQIIFAGLQAQGERENQEDFFANFNDECFALSDGVGGRPHGEVAAKLAIETAIWGYRQIRLRPYYWEEKKLFLKRIFRSVNIAVWQKHRESGYSEGLAATLIVLIIGPRNFFLGSVGDSSAFLYRRGVAKKITLDDLDESGRLTKAIGLNRFGLVPGIVVDNFGAGDTLLLASDGVTDYLSPDELGGLLAGSGMTKESLSKSVTEILVTAQNKGSTDNMTAIIVKRITSG